jgi:hypothetical protein
MLQKARGNAQHIDFRVCEIYLTSSLKQQKRTAKELVYRCIWLSSTAENGKNLSSGRANTCNS